MDALYIRLDLPRRSLGNFNDFRKELLRTGTEENRLACEEMDGLLKERKRTHRRLVTHHKHILRNQLHAEAMRNLRVNADLDNLDDDALENDDDELGADDQTYDLTLQEGASRDEPPEWAQFAENVEVNIVPSELTEGESPGSHVTRLQFFKSFAEAGGEQEIPFKDLTCILCKLDPTVPYSYKTKLYVRTKLDQHLKQDFHTREAQLMRAFHIDKDDHGNAKCPGCDVEGGARGFIKHLEAEHPELLEDE